ncbi:hypothetical protein [Vibrio chaetopteri]|jgi:hypothetical protein|uniref:Ferritin-like domain-containing protein n=1 Tax=Vibrio chaetopteri TaxID=3016528 RepID=A0AAU8BUQ6_9VIBR
MLNIDRLHDVSFLSDPHYKVYLKGKENIGWDRGLDWSLARNDRVPEGLHSFAIEVASMSAHVEVLGMQNAAELLAECSNFALKLGLGQAVNDEARHAELFAKYALLAGGDIRDCSKTQEVYDQHFGELRSFDEVFLSHVYLENGALEQFNVFISTFGEHSLIGQIYKGTLQDEARHVQMGVQYFKNKMTEDVSYADFVADHLADYREILHMNDNAVRWYSELSGLEESVIRQRIEQRHDSFIAKILGVG